MEFLRCYSCMGELTAPDSICPHCGYDNRHGPASQPDHALPCGTILNGKYVVGRSLGQGGFGITYIGYDLNLEQAVCIKEYFPSGAAMRSATQSHMVLWGASENAEQQMQHRKSFIKEAQRAVKLRNLGHVVSVWDVFYENDTSYIVMDYIKGESLKDHLIRSRRPLSEKECVDLLAPMMEDLSQAHKRGIIHRDIKPDNIMLLEENGEPVLLDMGAAKDLGKPTANGGVPSSTLVVSQGFSPPEQYRENGNIGAWTDVYAMCATMYYCVKGQVLPPAVDRMYEDTADFRSFSPAVGEVLKQGLAIRTESRIQSMDDLLLKLKAATAPQPTPQPQSNPEPQPLPKAQPQPLPKAQPQPLPKAQPQPLPKAQPQPLPKAQPQPKPEPQPLPKAQPQSTAGKKRKPKLLIPLLGTLALLAVLLVVFLPGKGAPESAVPVSSDSASSGSDSGSGVSGSDSGSGVSGSGVTLTIFNSKMEIQSQMEEMAKAYSAAKGVNVEVYYSSDTVAAHMSTKYASKDPYVLSMVDAKDIYSLGPEHAIDLSSEPWVGNTTQAISVGSKVLGFPVCVEARGLEYNADAIEAATGEAFDPGSIKTTADLQALLKKIAAGGMALPVGLQKEDWSLGAHYFAQIYELHDDPDAFIAGLKDGSVKLKDDPVFNAIMDTFDVLKTYNYAKNAPLSAEREVNDMMLAEGDLCFKFGGSWDWSNMVGTNYTEHLGIMPVPCDLPGYNEKLVGGGSKYFFIDNTVSAEQQQAAKDFLNWLVFDAEGQEFLVNTCALVPAFSNITLPVSDPLGEAVKAYTDKGALTANYNYQPDDHYAKVGALCQKYLTGQLNRVGLANEVTKYWASV